MNVVNSLINYCCPAPNLRAAEPENTHAALPGNNEATIVVVQPQGPLPHNNDHFPPLPNLMENNNPPPGENLLHAGDFVPIHHDPVPGEGQLPQGDQIPHDVIFQNDDGHSTPSSLTGSSNRTDDLYADDHIAMIDEVDSQAGDDHTAAMGGQPPVLHAVANHAEGLNELAPNQPQQHMLVLHVPAAGHQGGAGPAAAAPNNGQAGDDVTVVVANDIAVGPQVVNQAAHPVNDDASSWGQHVDF